MFSLKAATIVYSCACHKHTHALTHVYTHLSLKAATAPLGLLTSKAPKRFEDRAKARYIHIDICVCVYTYTYIIYRSLDELEERIQAQRYIHIHISICTYTYTYIIYRSLDELEERIQAQRSKTQQAIIKEVSSTEGMSAADTLFLKLLSGEVPRVKTLYMYLYLSIYLSVYTYTYTYVYVYIHTHT